MPNSDNDNIEYVNLYIQYPTYTLERQIDKINTVSNIYI